MRNDDLVTLMIIYLIIVVMFMRPGQPGTVNRRGCLPQDGNLSPPSIRTASSTPPPIALALSDMV